MNNKPEQDLWLLQSVPKLETNQVANLQLDFPHSIAVQEQSKKHQIKYLKTFAA